mmetsp:Transcript_16068/g.53882  ORF Transcript_16068/g.53882 Transcript_16068/m.53882 type:complete len:152 (-) Transcript_16068:1943-2398(-)
MLARVQSGRIFKTYWAILEGEVEADGSFELHFYSRYNRSKKISVTEKRGPRGKLGRCSWKRLQTLSAPSFLAYTRAPVLSAVEVDLVGGGQRHQIRAGFAFLGHPIVGDTLYGGLEWSQEGIALHSKRVSVEGVELSSPTPARMEWAFRAF